MLPPGLAGQRWKVKIREKERLESPHVTVIQGTKSWRFDLRTRSFMDDHPDPSEVPRGLVRHIEENIETLSTEWDKKYPHNPVSSGVGDEG